MSFSLPNNLSGLQYKWSALFLHHSRWVEVQQEQAVPTCSISLGDILNALSLGAYVVTSSTGHVPQLGFHWPHTHACWGDSSEEGHIFPRRSPAKIKVSISYGLSCPSLEGLISPFRKNLFNSLCPVTFGRRLDLRLDSAPASPPAHAAGGATPGPRLHWRISAPAFLIRKTPAMSSTLTLILHSFILGSWSSFFFFSWLVFSFSFFFLLQ